MALRHQRVAEQHQRVARYEPPRRREDRCKGEAGLTGQSFSLFLSAIPMLRPLLALPIAALIAGCPRPVADPTGPARADSRELPPAPPPALPSALPTALPSAAPTPPPPVATASPQEIPSVAPPIHDPAHRCRAGMALLDGGGLLVTSFKYRTPGAIDGVFPVATFCMDAHEVSEREYASCVKARACTKPGSPDPKDILIASCHGGAGEFDEHPVNCVNLPQVEAYCRYVGKRLPTREEWQWARHGGARATRFPWGDDEPGARPCWSGVVPRSTTCPVGSSPGDASPEGVLDLTGNVEEGTATRSIVLGQDTGGNWMGPGTYEATAVEGAFAQTPASFRDHIGFRCARAPQRK